MLSYCLRFDDKNIKTIIGPDCLDRFLDILENNAVVYFHNLGYDCKFFNRFNIRASVDKGKQVFNMSISYKGKNILFKDSAALTQMRLAQFPKAFKLKSGEKEMFPYNYYTYDLLFDDYGYKKGVGVIEEAGQDEKEWKQEEFVKILKCYIIKV